MKKNIILLFGILVAIVFLIGCTDTYYHCFFNGSLKVTYQEFNASDDDRLIIEFYKEGNYTFVFIPDEFNGCCNYEFNIDSDDLSCYSCKRTLTTYTLPNELIVRVWKDGLCESHTFVDQHRKE